MVRKKLIVGYSILVFCLLLVVSGAWAFFWREQLLRDASLHVHVTDVLSPLFEAGIFIFVLILVLLVTAILFGFIFTDKIFGRVRELARKLVELKSASFTSRLSFPTDDEFGDIATAANDVIDRLEHEIADALFKASVEQGHFKEEKNLFEGEQKQIYEEKEKLEYVLGRITDGVILLNRNRNIVLLNKAAEEIVGYSQPEVLNKQIGNIIKFCDVRREVLMDEYAPVVRTSALTDDAFVKKQIRLSSSQAGEKLVDLICVRLALIHTQDLGYMIVLHDLTETLEIEKKRISLLSSFAQELKQPLSLISDHFSSKQDSNMYLGKAGAANLSLLMENLLTTSAIESNTVSLAMAPVDLISVVKNSIVVVDPLAKAAQISLKYEQASDFNAVVSGDKDRISQVILNLLLNAIYYTAGGGSVSVSLSQLEGEIILRIQDTGVGIPTDELKNLFSKFYVGSSTKSLNSGIGLGLYVCRKLIELQQGKIWVDSVEGRGTVVSVSLKKPGEDEKVIKSSSYKGEEL